MAHASSVHAPLTIALAARGPARRWPGCVRASDLAVVDLSDGQRFLVLSDGDVVEEDPDAQHGRPSLVPNRVSMRRAGAGTASRRRARRSGSAGRRRTSRQSDRAGRDRSASAAAPGRPAERARSRSSAASRPRLCVVPADPPTRSICGIDRWSRQGLPLRDARVPSRSLLAPATVSRLARDQAWRSPIRSDADVPKHFARVHGDQHGLLIEDVRHVGGVAPHVDLLGSVPPGIRWANGFSDVDDRHVRAEVLPREVVPHVGSWARRRGPRPGRTAARRRLPAARRTSRACSAGIVALCLRGFLEVRAPRTSSTLQVEADEMDVRRRRTPCTAGSARSARRIVGRHARPSRPTATSRSALSVARAPARALRIDDGVADSASAGRRGSPAPPAA